MSIKPYKDVMHAAIQMAEYKEAAFGAALAMGDQVFATATSQINEISDPASHAEIRVIRQLSEQTGKKDLSGFTLYSTCEPCAECAKEIVEHDIQTVIYGCEFFVLIKYKGKFQSIGQVDATEQWNDVDRINGFLSEECEALLQKFL